MSPLILALRMLQHVDDLSAREQLASKFAITRKPILEESGGSRPPLALKSAGNELSICTLSHCGQQRLIVST